MPSYIHRYCNQLDDAQWQWFYEQMLEPVAFVTDISYLFYELKWILKYDFDDLSYAVYFQAMMNPECMPQPPIKEEWLSTLRDRYVQRWKKELSDIHYSSMDTSVTDSMDDDPVIF